MKLQIAVIGSHRNNDDEVLLLAREVGKEIAKRGHVLLNGACTGIPCEAAKEARNFGGLVVGISPIVRGEKHSFKGLDLDSANVLVSTGMGYKGRNVILIRSADGVVVLGRGFGTLNETTIAEGEKRPIIALTGSGRTAELLPQLFEKLSPDYEFFSTAKTPREAIDKLEKLVAKKESQ